MSSFEWKALCWWGRPWLVRDLVVGQVATVPPINAVVLAEPINSQIVGHSEVVA